MKLIKQTIGLTLTGVIALAAAGSTFAADNIKIKNNGSDSYNKVKVSRSTKHKVQQSAYTNNYTEINVSQNTGKNDVKDNTGSGATTINTGKIVTDVVVSNTGSLNVIEGDNCGCVPDSDLDVAVTGNGTDPTNKVEFSNNHSFYNSQYSKTFNTTLFGQHANTGDNEVEDNTSSDDGKIVVKTGVVKTTVSVVNFGSVNQQ